METALCESSAQDDAAAYRDRRITSIWERRHMQARNAADPWLQRRGAGTDRREHSRAEDRKREIQAKKIKVGIMIIRTSIDNQLPDWAISAGKILIILMVAGMAMVILRDLDAMRRAYSFNAWQDDQRRAEAEADLERKKATT